MEQQIRFCTTSDGVRIAYAVTGSGYPLVWIPGWLSHAEIDWDWPVLGERYRALTKDFTLLRLDKRGTGLSARGLPSYSRDAWVQDVEAVVEHAGLSQFALAGYSEGGPVAIDYAARHPDRVSHLILMGTGADFAGEGGRKVLEALITIIKTNWGSAVKMMSDFFLGEDAPPEAQQTFARYQRQSAHAADAAAMLRVAPEVYDIAGLAPEVRVPTLIIHGRQDQVIPIEYGQRLAALIPGAAFKSVEGQHIPGRKEGAEIEAAIREFVLGVSDGMAREGSSATAIAGPLTVLFTDVEGSTALTQRLGDDRAREVLRAHERIVRDALAAHGGTEVKAMGDGFMAAFASATAALQCAIAIQRAFAEHRASAEEPVRVRVGLNAGEPIAEDDDLFGTAVILAARIAAKAKGGEILASNVVRELTAGKGFVFANRGETELRGFEDPVRLFEVRWQT